MARSPRTNPAADAADLSASVESVMPGWKIVENSPALSADAASDAGPREADFEGKDLDAVRRALNVQATTPAHSADAAEAGEARLVKLRQQSQQDGGQANTRTGLVINNKLVAVQG